MLGDKKKKKHFTILVQAYASLLQQELGVIVTPCIMYSGYQGDPLPNAPCSVVTVEPFVPGGLRRLVLNARHSLILTLAQKACTSKERNVAIEMGKAML